MGKRLTHADSDSSRKANAVTVVAQGRLSLTITDEIIKFNAVHI